jgi:hypothetical protein
MPAFARDLLERVALTFLQAFGAVLIASDWFTVGGIVDVSILGAAGLAGIAAVLAFVKGIVARLLVPGGSASLDPENRVVGTQVVNR